MTLNEGPQAVEFSAFTAATAAVVRSGSAIEPFGALRDVAVALALEHLRTDIANAVLLFLAHDPLDLNVSRVAFARSMSRWTLRRRVWKETGRCANDLVALTMLFNGLACLLWRAHVDMSRAPQEHRALTRGERRVMRLLLKIKPAQLMNVIQRNGIAGVEVLLRTRLDPTLLRTTAGRSGVPSVR